MGYVQEYGNGKYRARKRVDGKLVSKSFDSRADAWTWVEASTPPAVAPATSRLQIPSVAGPIVTVRQFFEGGGFVLADQRHSTRIHKVSMVNVHILPRWGGTPLSALTHQDIQSWIVADPAMTKLAPRTVRNIGSTFRKLLGQAVTAGLIPANPADSIVYPRADHEEMRFLNTAQVQALHEAMIPRFKPFVLLGAYGGLRIGEAMGLRWGQVDLFAGRVEVIQTATEVDGHVIVGPPKTKSSRRAVSIPRLAVYALRDHRTAQGGNPAPDAWVFPGEGPNGGPTASGTFRRTAWARAVAAAGLTPLRPHDLRHTAVSFWIAAGASPKEVAARAGHSSVSFSLDVYGHLFPSQDVALTNRLDDLIERGVE